jgi:hypothetical protein
MEDLSLKSNFIGRDGFVWWIGQIPPLEAWDVQSTGGGWGVRYKVRIMGYHPYTEAELSNEDLPWAHVMLPPGHGTGSANTFKSVRFNPGDTVIGFFLDGADGQHPVIMGAFANSVDAVKDGEKLPFAPFSGYNEHIKEPPKGALKKSESGDQNAATAKQPTGTSPADAKKIDPDNPAAKRTSDGKIIRLPCGTEGEETKGNKGTITKIKNAIEGFVQFLQDLKAQFDEGLEYYRDWVDREIDIRAEQITKAATKMISGMVNSLFKKLESILSKGLDLLYGSVYATVFAATLNPVAAHLAGVAAQTAMLQPVKILQDLIPCIVNQILGKVFDLVKDLLKSVANNVLNFVDCVADQTVGAMINGIIGLLDNAILPAINGISKILQFFEDFSVEGLLRNGIDALLGLVGLKSCNKKNEKDKYGACKYKLGYGPVFQDEPDLKGIIDNANTAKAISTAAKVAGFPLDGVQDIAGAFDFITGTVKDPNFIGDVGSCYTGPPIICGPPKINIFGGGGTGASAVPILGGIVGEDKYKTGSVISVKVTNPGSGYTFPPFVEVVDNCNQGYGAIARAIVKNGQVDTIYVVSEGENYPADEELPYIVESVTVIDPGQGFEDGDRVVDNQGNEYDVKIQSGAIIKVTPINSKDVTNIPVLEVISKNGSGAILAANLGERPPFDGEVKQVIDCIT